MKKAFGFALLLCSAAVTFAGGSHENGWVDQSGIENNWVESGKELIQTGLELPPDHTSGSPVPAVVFVPGSGQSIFPDYTDGMIDLFLRDAFADRGYAIIHYNKRGVGGSTGTSNTTSIESRSVDVQAIIDFYRDDPRIDPASIGIVGHSQGGWVVTRVGALDPEVSFVISLAGPTTTVREQDMGFYNLYLDCEGISGDVKERRMARHERKHERMIAVGAWLPLFQLRFMHNILNYDPRESIENLTQPTLIALGEYDNQAPAIASARRFAEIFPSQSPGNITLHVAPKTDHFFHVTDSYCLDYVAALDDPFSADFVEFYMNWVRANTPSRADS